MRWQIQSDSLESPAVLALLREHLAALAPTAPPESRHALALAHALYRSFGFEPCPPFGAYKADPNSLFMALTL